LRRIAPAAAKSEPLAAFVRESNRGAHVWFVASAHELRHRLEDTRPDRRRPRRDAAPDAEHRAWRMGWAGEGAGGPTAPLVRTFGLLS